MQTIGKDTVKTREELVMDEGGNLHDVGVSRLGREEWLEPSCRSYQRIEEKILVTASMGSNKSM